MLIYNYKKEFLGIDEADLDALGLETLADLREESADFADLFVRTPGCIHNFKHVHWIDYVLDKDGAEAKVIIHVKNKNYSANLSIDTAYLVDSPAQKAFCVALLNIRLLSSAQTEKLLTDINNKPTPIPANGTTELFTIASSVVADEETQKEEEFEEEKAPSVSYDPYESTQEDSLSVEDVYETEDDTSIEEDILEFEDEIEDTKEDIAEITPELIEEEENEEKQEEVKEEVIAPEITTIDGKFAQYTYNPELASEELGLPIDLIEEFIQDFIAQALSFKDELYQSVETEQLDNIKIQSHKLKGVAANLRIEDALDVLTTINTASDYDIIKTNLDKLYIMINNLSSSKTNLDLAQDALAEDVKVDEDDDEELILSFKEDKLEEDLEITDDDVPESISIAELADDDFLATDILDSEIYEDQDDDLIDEDLAYDKELIANDIGIDLKSFNELFNDYVKESKELAQTISQSADNNDLSICKSLAGKIKGMSENMRINKLDAYLNNIVNTTDTQIIKTSAQEIISKLDEINAQE